MSTMRTAEQEAVLRSVRKLIDFWQIEADELAGVPAPEPRPEPTPTAPVHRYRHPITGQAWDGRGGQPAWLREALTREGYTVEELRLSESDSGDPLQISPT